MSLFTDASLVMIPSGIKDQKVYSVTPTDGSGDLTFSRASNATRVNSSGLVEKVRTNLALYSEQFDNANWQKTSSGTGVVPVVTANTTTAPDGTTTADTIVFNSGAGTTSSDYSTIYQLFSVSSATYTFSFYGKVASGTADIMLRLDSSQGYITKTLTTTWQRFDIKFTGASGFVEIGIRRGINEPIVSSATVQLWGAMMEVSDFGPTNYIATTSAAVSVGATANTPRLDYSGGASCPSLLLEGQRTNKQTFSEQISTTNYPNSSAINVTANAGISPDGYQNADKVIPTTANTDHQVKTNAATLNGYDIISAFVKADGYNYVQLTSWADTSNYVNFDLTDGTVGTASVATIYGIQSYGNGWYRIWANVQASGAGIVGIGVITSKTAGWAQSFAGNGTDGVLMWGIQIEASATYPSSYIPTLSSAVTKVADSASKTGISSLIGQTEGTIFFEYPSFNSDYNQGLIGIDDGSGNNRILFYSDTNNRITAQVRTNGVTQQPSSYSVSGNVKVAIAYNSTGFVFYVNGTLRFTGTAVVFSNTMSALTFNHVGIGGSITNQALLFKTRLSNADLATLTA